MPNQHPPEPSRKTPKIFYVVTPIISIVATLLLLEFALALFYPIPHPLSRNMYYEADPHTGYRIRPYSEGVYWGNIPALANAHGHRDDPVTWEKPAGVQRVLVLGDSFTIGATVHQQEAYAQQIETMLTQVEIINTGVGGWGPYQYAQYYEHYGRAYDPDLVLVGVFVGNDTFIENDNELTAVYGMRIPNNVSPLLGKIKVLLHKNSHIARLYFDKNKNEAADVTRDNCEDFSEVFIATQKIRRDVHFSPDDAAQVARAENSLTQLERLQALADEDGIPLIIALFPDENQLNPALQEVVYTPDERATADFAMPQTLFRTRLTRPHNTVVDLQPVFLDDPRCLYMNDTHWSAEGHALVAETLTPIIEQYLLP